MRFDSSTRLHSDARSGLLVGGRPLQVLRLDARGAALVRRWRQGAEVSDPAELHLARRLHDRGIVLLQQPASHRADEVTVVVPVRDRAASLRRCLASLGLVARVLVVDDASVDAAAVASVVDDHHAQLVRRDVNGGPAAARNTGLALVRTPLVAFVDSDCVLLPGWLDRLLPALLDEQVGAVAPRVVGAGGPGILARYERHSGPLDLGPLAGPAAPGARVGYVPAAVLLCRRDALLESGFDETMRVGEDVDLVWRLRGHGLSVRYEPAVVASHEARPTVVGWLRQRFGYGSSAAQLDLRHPGAVAPAAADRWSLAVLGSLVAREPILAGVMLGLRVSRLWHRLPQGPGRSVESVRLTTAGVGWSAVSLAEGAARTWLPALLLGSLLPGAPGRAVRRVAAVSLGVRLARALAGLEPTSGARPALATWTLLRLVDDFAYATGVWWGAVRERRFAVLLPRLS